MRPCQGCSQFRRRLLRLLPTGLATAFWTRPPGGGTRCGGSNGINQSNLIKMTAGGTRIGAGRRPGALGKKTIESKDRIEKAISSGLTPLEYMLEVLRDPNTTLQRR